ncbi:PAS domain-containing protein [Aminirod propionatiphilus]|uniref:PAS domain-containing protein n=1 Tax=Aminirod propionatiphilus TaxID=3415223 RepID=A0ACD1DUU7_9BACT|nr:PAS domain-containing protein [Synergistota bacterium]
MGPITPWVEAFLTGLFEHLPEGIVLRDERQIVLRANPAFCRLFGYAEEAAGRFLDDLVAGGTPGYGEAVAYTESILSGRSVKVPATRHAKDGTAVDVLATSVPIFDGGRVVGVLALYGDISESVRSRHALEETKARLEATLEGIGDAVVTVDERGNVTDLNAAASSLTGWPVDEARGLPASSLLRFRSGDGNPSPLLEGHPGEAAETLLVDRSGLAHPVTVQTTPVRLGRERTPGVVVRDESERLRRRAEITAAQALYGSLVDSLPDRVFRFSPSGRCLFAPPRAEESLAVAHPPWRAGPSARPGWTRPSADAGRPSSRRRWRWTARKAPASTTAASSRDLDRRDFWPSAATSPKAARRRRTTASSSKACATPAPSAKASRRGERPSTSASSTSIPPSKP